MAGGDRLPRAHRPIDVLWVGQAVGPSEFGPRPSGRQSARMRTCGGQRIPRESRIVRQNTRDADAPSRIRIGNRRSARASAHAHGPAASPASPGCPDARSSAGSGCGTRPASRGAPGRTRVGFACRDTRSRPVPDRVGAESECEQGCFESVCVRRRSGPAAGGHPHRPHGSRHGRRSELETGRGQRTTTSISTSSSRRQTSAIRTRISSSSPIRSRIRSRTTAVSRPSRTYTFQVARPAE